MKTLKKTFLVIGILIAGPMFNACTDYQDEIDALDYRVTVLENLVNRLNSELESMQVIVDAVENGDFITDVTENSEGYIITFNKSGAIIIHDGQNGRDGLNGRDAQAPEITVEEGEDGVYYWVINGVPLVGPDGEKVRASGRDGKDGQDGLDGLDGKDGRAVAPQVRINPTTSMWEISVDGGITWVTTDMSCKGKDGKDGKDGQDGKDGLNGIDGNTIIQTITFFMKDGVTYVRFTHAGGYFDVPLITT